jgi:hypothetical protein
MVAVARLRGVAEGQIRKREKVKRFVGLDLRSTVGLECFELLINSNDITRLRLAYPLRCRGY